MKKTVLLVFIISGVFIMSCSKKNEVIKNYAEIDHVKA